MYALTGTYRNVYRRSRLKELGQTVSVSLIGVLLIFFTLLLDDFIVSYKSYYQTFFTLFLLHCGLTATIRLVLATNIISRIQKKKIVFNTILVGSNQNALTLYQEMETAPKLAGNHFLGFVHVDGTNGHKFNGSLPHLGSYTDLRKHIEEKQVEEVIIAIESSEHESI